MPMTWNRRTYEKIKVTYKEASGFRKTLTSINLSRVSPKRAPEPFETPAGNRPCPLLVALQKDRESVPPEVD